MADQKKPPGQVGGGFTATPKKTKTGTTKVTLQEVVVAGKKAGIPDSFLPYFAAIIQQESGGNFDPSPNASGAVGPGQVVGYPTPKAGEDLHKWAMGALAASAKHFYHNIQDNNGDLQKSIGAYYTGQGNIDKNGVSTAKVSNGPSVADYVSSVIQIAAVGANYGGASTPAQKTLQRALVTEAQNTSAAYQAAKTQAQVQNAATREAVHLADPWVTVQKDKSGKIIGFGSTTGFNPPANVLMYAGEPVTKGTLSSIWGARYADIYEEFTGKSPTSADVATVLGLGLSGPGLMQYLSKRPGFQQSPIWKKTAHGIQQTAQNILGANVSAGFVKQAIAGQWDQQTIEYNMRRYKTPSGVQPYLTGPEYTANSASLKGQYQKIYGLPDATGNQAIGEAAASGWTAEAFGSYLRSLPQYKTSLEYQSNAVAFLDQLGLLTGAGPSQLPRGDNITPSLQTVPNSPLVPGKPSPINASLPFTPTLALPGKAP